VGTSNTAPDPAATPLASKTVTSFDNSLTAATWADLSKQHVSVAFSGDEMNFSLGGVQYQWLVVSLLTTAGKVLTVAAGLIDVREDGYNSAGTAPVLTGSAYTKAEALALFAGPRNDIIGRSGGNATDLDSIATAAGAWPTGHSVRTCSGVSGGREEWILIAGTSAEAPAAGIVRPDDYDGSTNARIWKQIL
jgi:hypothetical protein